MEKPEARPSFENTIGYLVSRWQPTDRTLLRQLFPLLAQGKPIPPSRLAEVSGRDVATVEQALGEGHAGRDHRGRIVELFGIALTPARHRIQIGSICVFSCCALVSHVVPLLLSQTVIIESVDPISGRLVRVFASPAGLHSVEPSGAVATLVATTEQQIEQDVRSAFCMHVHHFADADSAGEFARENSGRFVTNLLTFNDAALQLGRAVWS